MKLDIISRKEHFDIEVHRTGTGRCYLFLPLSSSCFRDIFLDWDFERSLEISS